MKKINILGKIVSAVTSAVMIGTMAVSAESAEENNKLYKFSELLPMSQEEFVSLDGSAERWYEIVYNIIHPAEGKMPYEYDYMDIMCMGIAYDDTLRMDDDEIIETFGTLENYNDYHQGVYKPFKTEEKLTEYLDVPEINFDTPLHYSCTDEEFQRDYYAQFIVSIGYHDESLYDPDLQKYGINDENILLAAKLNYCVNQLYNASYCSGDLILDSNTPNFAEINGDDKLNILDAAYIAKYVAKRQTELLPKAADFNMDGKINIGDAASIARFMCLKAGARIKGWIK